MEPAIPMFLVYPVTLVEQAPGRPMDLLVPARIVPVVLVYPYLFLLLAISLQAVHTILLPRHTPLQLLGLQYLERPATLFDCSTQTVLQTKL